MTCNIHPLPEPAWDGAAGTIRQFIRNYARFCERSQFNRVYYVQDILNFIPASQFKVWERVARGHPDWDDFVKKILEYYPEPSLVDSCSRMDQFISENKAWPSCTSNKCDFFAYLRGFTVALSAIEYHRAVPNSEKVSKFSGGLAPIIRELIDKHNPQDMNEVIAAGNAVFDYIGLLDSKTMDLFKQLVYEKLEICQQSVIVQGYTPLSTANRDEPGLTVVSHGQTDT
ncbi:hypothetical protein FA15DRAFT_760575 [Coprinopsis marcescibilis]|uniref:Retrotransposon gag domain-containing protein n=1 Tax=Coprinopsis marcescibilis TaxID=230819 RepID=A0A5C3KES1_COPMA|nr:hypothetical protein FA15DRAFT_760575 [Coprinopsis marcescibilis]